MAGRADEPLPFDVEIPDDARELWPEVLAWRREQRTAARRARLGRWLAPRRGPFGLLAAVVAVTLFAAGGLVLGTVGPRLDAQSPSRPLATRFLAAVGSVGGLLPDLRVRLAGAERALRDLRPAVLALVPARCRCGGLVAGLAAQAEQFGLPLALVASGADAGELPRLVQDGAQGVTEPVTDPAGQLAWTYHRTGVTLVLVRSDGVVTAVDRAVVPGQGFELELGGLTQ